MGGGLTASLAGGLPTGGQFGTITSGLPAALMGGGGLSQFGHVMPGMVAPGMAGLGGFSAAASAAGPVDVAAAKARLSNIVASMAPAATASPSAPLTGHDKVLRELYVGGLTPGMGFTAPAMQEFMNTIMTQSGMARGPGNPCTVVRVAENGTFAFFQFRSTVECDLALQLNGVAFMGVPLKMMRPKGYQQALASPAGIAALQAAEAAGLNTGASAAGLGLGAPPPLVAAGMPGAPAAGGAGGGAPLLALPAVMGLMGGSRPAAAAGAAADDAPVDVILATNLAVGVTLDMLREIMQSFGPIAHAAALPPAPNGTGRALVAYEAAATITDTVLGGLNGLDIGGAHLALARAPRSLVAQHLPAALPAPPPPVAATASAPASTSPAANGAPTPRLVLTNMATPADVATPADTTALCEDVAEECGRYGTVVEVTVGGVTPGEQSVPVYVTFATSQHAEAAAAVLRGRRFDGRAVGVSFVPAPAPPPLPPAAAAAAAAEERGGWDAERAADAGQEGGVGGHFGGTAVPPPPASAWHGTTSASGVGAPEDGMALPPVPAAADVD